MSVFPEQADYDVEELRELAGVPGIPGDSEVMLDEVPNYECPYCSSYVHIDDHKQRAPNWCESCNDIRQFKKLD